MPTITPTRVQTQNTRAFVQRWSNLAASDDGQPLGSSQYTDRSVQVSGVFGGASVRIEGSNDGTNWAPLTDPQGNQLLFVSAGLEMVTEATLHIRPLVLGGDGTTNLTVNLLVKE